MHDDDARYEMTGFPGVVIPFIRAMEASRMRAATEHGLSSIEFRALFRVAESGELTPKTLASDLGVSNGAVTGLSDRLIAAGLLQRQAHPEDRRSLYLTLSRQGHQAMREMHAGLNEMLEVAVEGIDPGDLEVLSAALRQVTESISARS